MAAPEGNNFAMRFKTTEERQQLAGDYLEHCREGLSDESFRVDPATLRRYERDFPEDFATIKDARILRRLFWEKLGIDGALGKIKGFNAASWIFNMRNRFGWRDQNLDPHLKDLNMMTLDEFAKIMDEREKESKLNAKQVTNDTPNV